MAVGTLAQEVAKLGTGDANGIIDLGARDRVILSLVKTVTDAINTLASGKIYIGDSNNAVSEVTPSGLVTMSTAGVVEFTTTRGYLATTASNGEITFNSNIGITSNSVVLAVPNESCAAVHVIPAANKVTCFEAGTTNVINAKKIALLVVKV